MPNYQRGKIYAIRSRNDPELVYIGSTCDELRVRLAGHRRDYKRFQNGKYGNTTSFQVLAAGDAYIELIEEYPCNSKMLLNKREGEVMRATECVNKNIAGNWVGKTEAEYKAEYRAANREQIKEQQNEKCVCQCGGRYTRKHKSHHLKTTKHQFWKYVTDLLSL